MNKVSTILVAVLALLVGGLVGSYLNQAAVDSNSQENLPVISYKVGYAGGEVPEVWNTLFTVEPLYGVADPLGFSTDKSPVLKGALLWAANAWGSIEDKSIYYSQEAFEINRDFNSDGTGNVQVSGFCLPEYSGDCPANLMISVYGMDSADMDKGLAVLKSNSGFIHSTIKTGFQTFDRIELADKEQPDGNQCSYYTKSKNGKIGISIHVMDCAMENPYTMIINAPTPIDHFIETVDVNKAALPDNVTQWTPKG